MSKGEKLWVMVAVLAIVVGVAVGILHQLKIVPLWASTTSTVLTGAIAIVAAVIAARSSYRNEKNG